jgi:hypothetical protein
MLILVLAESMEEPSLELVKYPSSWLATFVLGRLQ